MDKVKWYHFSEVFWSLINGVSIPLIKDLVVVMALTHHCYNKGRECGSNHQTQWLCLSSHTPWSFEVSHIIGQPLSYLGFHCPVLSCFSFPFSDHRSLPSLLVPLCLFFFLCPKSRYSQVHPQLLVLSLCVPLVVSSTPCATCTVLKFWPPSKASVLQCNVPFAPKAHNIWNGI